MIRKGKEYYSMHYDNAIRLYEQGMEIKEIAQKLGISYSCVYHWARGIRKPEAGNPADFVKFLEDGPKPVLEVKSRFPKHNEIFLICSRRNMGVKRAYLGRKYLEYSTWYYLEGQENLLRERIEKMFSKIKEFRESLKGSLERVKSV